MNTHMVLILNLVSVILLYDLVVQKITCFFPRTMPFYYASCGIYSVVYSNVTMVAISEAFPNITRLPHRL